MNQIKTGLTVAIFSLIVIPLSVSHVNAEFVPDWVKNTAKWYGEGAISETEFLNAIKFLIENNFIVLESEKLAEEKSAKAQTMNIIIPHGNYDIANAGFYIPLNAEIEAGTTVVWVNDDSVPHTVQSQDVEGNIIGLFNSAPLETGERFAHTFDDPGVYNYYCTLHPWRIGLVTVS